MSAIQKKNPKPSAPGLKKRTPQASVQQPPMSATGDSKKDAADRMNKKASRMALMAAIGDAESPVKTAQSQDQAKGDPESGGQKEIPGTPVPEEPPAPSTPDAPPTTAKPKQKEPAEDAGIDDKQKQTMAEESQDAIVETAMQVVEDNAVPIRLGKCDPDITAALQVAEDKLAAIASASGGAAIELPRTALAIGKGQQVMSDVRQPEVPAALQNSVREQAQKLKTPGENPPMPAVPQVLPEPEPTE